MAYTCALHLTHAQLMALRSLVAAHLLCPKRTEVYVDCSTGDLVETTHEELLAILMQPCPLTADAVEARKDGAIAALDAVGICLFNLAEAVKRGEAPG